MICLSCHQEIRKRRTLGANSFYWFYLSLIEAETGNRKEDLHSLFKRVFLPPRWITVLGRELKIPATTTTLTPYEMSEYIKKIEVETGILAPHNEI